MSAADSYADYYAGCFKSGRKLHQVEFERFANLSSEEQKQLLVAKWNEFPLSDEADGTTLDIAGLQWHHHQVGTWRTSTCKYYVFLKPAEGKAIPFAFIDFDDFRFKEVSFMYFPDTDRTLQEIESFEIEEVFRSNYRTYKKRQASA